MLTAPILYHFLGKMDVFACLFNIVYLYTYIVFKMYAPHSKYMYMYAYILLSKHTLREEMQVNLVLYCGVLWTCYQFRHVFFYLWKTRWHLLKGLYIISFSLLEINCMAVLFPASFHFLVCPAVLIIREAVAFPKVALCQSL